MACTKQSCVLSLALCCCREEVTEEMLQEIDLLGSADAIQVWLLQHMPRPRAISGPGQL